MLTPPKRMSGCSALAEPSLQAIHSDNTAAPTTRLTIHQRPRAEALEDTARPGLIVRSLVRGEVGGEVGGEINYPAASARRAIAGLRPRH